MKTALWMMLATLAVAMIGCGQGAEEGELTGEIKIAGSSTVYPISMAMAEEFMKMHPKVVVSVSSTGTGGGFSNFFIPGETQINDASRPIKQSEIDAAQANGITPIELQVGIDALSVVINPEADWVDSMTFEQLRAVWGPNNPPQQWSQVDPSWPAEDFELYGPAATSGTFDYFTEEVIGEGGAHRSDYNKTEHDNTIVQGIAGNRYAMGYFGYAYYNQNRDSIKALAIAAPGGEPVEPSLDNAQSGAYPLSRPLFIYVSDQALADPAVRAFVEFYIEQAATDLVEQVGYVPVTEAMMQENMRKIEEAAGE